MQHIITHAITDDIAASYEAELQGLAAHQARYAAAPLPHMQLAAQQHDIAAMHDMAGQLADGAARIVLLGTGGSSLGGQVLAQINGWGTIAGQAQGPHLVFVDNLDADSYTRLLEADLRKTKFFVVSKSGNTAETMMQLGGAVLALERDGLAVAKHIGGIAGAQDNALRRLAAHYGFALLAHEEAIGGRFSVLSNVGLMPAIWAGLDPMDVRRGAARVLDNFADADFAPLHGAALNLEHMRAGRNIAVLMPYADRLDRLAFWYRQLWAESLGKQGKGSVPTNALGPVDQHSQMQLYLDGPDDKLYTLVTHATRQQGPSVPDSFAADSALAGLAGHQMGDLVEAEAQASLKVLAATGRPVRHIHLPHIDAEAVGALLMHFQLEVIFAADGLGVNALDQPAVDLGKAEAQAYLAALKREG